MSGDLDDALAEAAALLQRAVCGGDVGQRVDRDQGALAGAQPKYVAQDAERGGPTAPKATASAAVRARGRSAVPVTIALHPFRHPEAADLGTRPLPKSTAARCQHSQVDEGSREHGGH